MQRISTADPNFLYTQDGRLFRQLVDAPLIQFALSKLFTQLMELKFIPEHKHIGNNVYEVQQIKRITYPPEWNVLQMLEATKLICNINILLLESKSEILLCDMHTHNAVFDKTHPYYVDVGSFSRPYMGPGPMMKSFYDELDWYATEFKIPGLVQIPRIKTIPTVREWHAIISWLDHINADVWVQANQWDNYDKSPSPEIVADVICTSKEQSKIMGWIKSLKPKDAIDVGCNKGIYSRLTAKEGIDVWGFDVSHKAILKAYKDNKKLQLPVAYVILDVLHPVNKGFAAKFGGRPNVSEWPQRVRSDLVLASSIGHHLAIGGFSLKEQAALYNLISKRYLIVEFVGPKDRGIANWKFPTPYNLDVFYSSLSGWTKLDEFDDLDYPSRKFCLYRK